MSNNENEILRNLDLMIEGRFHEVGFNSDVQSELEQKILKLAETRMQGAMDTLEKTVHFAMATNQGIKSIARTNRYVVEVNDDVQAIDGAIKGLNQSLTDISAIVDETTQEVHEMSANTVTVIKASEQAQASMDEIANTVHTAADQVSDLSSTSAEIGKIIREIDDIAKQTNLLALNATIEAARAGEMGRGFAVVAGEVKGLAAQTSAATDTIRGRIETLQANMASIVETMEVSEGKVQEGRSVIANATQEMSTITTQTAAVDRHISTINTIIEEQVSAAHQVSDRSSSIVDKSNQNTQALDHIVDELGQVSAPMSDVIDTYVVRGDEMAVMMAAMSDHNSWVRKLTMMLIGKVKIESHVGINDHTMCRFGKWFAAQTDPKLVNHPSWQALVGPHKIVHASGIEAIKAYNAGDMPKAIQHVKEADIAAEQVVDNIRQVIQSYYA